MKKLLTLFLVVGVLGIYAETTENEIQAETDTIQQADTISIENPPVEGDTISVIKENIDSISVSNKGNEDSLIMIKKNPWLYDWRYGCLTDGLTYLIPMITLYSIAERVDDKFLPLDNYCTPCIYPIGLVFVERMWKRLLLKEEAKGIDENINISLSVQSGEALPYYEYPYYNEIGIPNIGFLDLNLICLRSGKRINNRLNINLLMQLYNYYIYGLLFYSTGIEAEVNEFNVIVEKIVFGIYPTESVPYALAQYFKTNNYAVSMTNDDYIVNFKYDFWGVGIGWGKKYKIWKELYIEPMLNYKFIYTFDFKAGCITGLVGGIGIGYKF